MRQILDNLKAILTRFTFNQKILMGVIIGAAVISVTIFSVWLQNEEKAVLFTNLRPEDASLAINELGKLNVEAELTNGGTTIMVPENVVHRLRVDLSAKGIPSSGTVGWGIFDGKQYGMTEFIQNVNFKRALEGELTQTIESINGIRAARVHLVLPKPSIFKKMQSPATATIVLTLGRGTVLSPSQIQGMQSLVSGGVEGLEKPNVSVLDQYGVVLSDNYGNEGLARSDSQLAMKKEVDAYLAEKAQGMLARVLGPNRAIVRVDATLNFEQLEQQRHTYDPNQTVVRSEERNESSAGESDINEQSTINYEINETIETVVGEIGGVKTMTVAVFVDGSYADDGDDAEPVYTPLPEEELEQIQRIVQSAVGLNTERGDRIEVVNMQFQVPTAIPEEQGIMVSPLLQTLPQTIGKILLFALAIFMAFRLRNALGDMAGQSYEPSVGPKQQTSDALDIDILETDATVVTLENNLNEVRDFAGSNPQEIADLVQAWVGDAEGT